MSNPVEFPSLAWRNRPPSGVGQIEAALNAGDRDRAITLALAAHAQGVSHPLIYNLRALKAEREGRWSDALADLQTAVDLAPGDPTLRNTLGLALGRLGRVQEAIQAFESAATLQPVFYAAWRNLGMAQIAAGDVKGARSSLIQASALAPQDAEPLGQLAALAARRGDWPDAQTMAEAALALDPELPSAVRALAETEMRQGRCEAAADRLEGWLARWRGAPATRRLIIGLLGDVRERQGLYPEALAAYALGNTETRKSHSARFGDDGLLEALRQLNAAARALRQDAFTEPVSPPASQVRRHIFLMGYMRSGTTLLEQAFAVRDDVTVLEEQEALALGVQSYLSDTGGLARLAQADEAALQRHRDDYWTRVRGYGVEPAGTVFVDKSPFNGVKLPLIRRLFPEAKIVFSIRDPRDVVLSCFKHRFVISHYTYQLLELHTGAAFYDAYMRLVERYLSRFSIPMLCYRHEDLVDDYEMQVRAICDFVGLAWRDEMADIGARVRAGLVSSPSAVQLRDGLSRTGLQTWKRYEAELADIMPTLERWVKTFGYLDEGVMAEPWSQTSLHRRLSNAPSDAANGPTSG